MEEKSGVLIQNEKQANVLLGIGLSCVGISMLEK